MTTETQFNNIVNIMTKYQNNSIRIYNDDKITEENIMSALFSNTLMIDENAKKYFLKYQYTDVYENILQKTKFYGLNFNSVQPDSTKKNIYDIDVSYYNKQDVMKYYVLLDLLSELYGSLSAKGLLSKTITIKSRYVIEDNQIVLYKKSDYYTFDIHYNYDSISGISKYAIINVQNKDMTDMVINMYDIYKNDILKHLNYINKNDITYSTKEYLYNIQSFYKFCRLKLIYYTLACSAKINKKVDNFILEYLSFSFLNLKSSIVLKNIDNNSLDLSNQFLLTSDKLDKLNQKIYKSQNKIKKNNNIQKQLNNSFIKYIFWIIVIIAVIMTIGTYILYHSKSFNPRGIVDILIITIIIIIYVICHYIMKLNIKEKFEILSKLPNPVATSNDYNTIKIIGSSKQSGTDYWHAFDNNKKTSWNTAINTYSDGKASTTFKSDYKGEFIMIDLGNAYTVKKYGINFKDINKGPGKFRLYVSNSANSWNNLNDSGWKMIHDVSSVSNDYTQVKEDIPVTNTTNTSIRTGNISSSGYGSLFLTSDGKVLRVGENYYGVLGFSGSYKYITNLMYAVSSTNVPLTDIVQVASGISHSLFLQKDGKVLSCGLNYYGCLGRFTDQTRWSSEFKNVTISENGEPLTNIVQISAGGYASVFLKQDSTVLGCGYNGGGGLGNSITNKNISNNDYPSFFFNSQNTKITNIIQIVSSGYSTFLLTNEGKALACGNNVRGQLGIGNNNNTTIPTYVKKDGSILTNIVQIASSIHHTLILLNNGNVLACGYNYYGALGNRTNNNINNPSFVLNDKGTASLTDIIQVSAGEQHSLFLQKDGKALSCGTNYYYKLGHGKSDVTITLPKYVTTIQQDKELTNIVNIYAGYYSSYFILNDSSVLYCGLAYGYLSNGLRYNATLNYVMIDNIPNDNLNNSFRSGESNTIFKNIKKLPIEINLDSSIYQKEYLLSNNYNNTVSQINSNKNYIRQTISSLKHSLYIQNDGKVLGEGQNNYGQLGTGNTNSASYPVYALDSQGVALTNIIEVCTGSDSSFFLKNDGTVLSCGYNFSGQLGIGTYTNTIIPSPVLSPSGVILKDIVQISASKGTKTFSLFLQKDGKVLSCGAADYGQLGYGSLYKISIPKYVKYDHYSDPIVDIVQVSAGDSHSLFLQKDGRVRGCGFNRDGELGYYKNIELNSTVSFPSLISVYRNGQIISITDIIQVSAGLVHSLFLHKDGTVLGCGLNHNGQLGGLGDSAIYINPGVFNTKDGILKNIVQINAGSFYSSFLMNNNTVFTCGYVHAWNAYSQDYNSAIWKNSGVFYPVPVTADKNGSVIKDVIQISGYGEQLFLQKDGKVLRINYLYRMPSAITNINIGGIIDINNQKYVLKSDGTALTNVATNINTPDIQTISKDVVDRNNNYGYRYCAFVINELTGSDSSLQITNLDIYGVEKVIPPEPVIQSPVIQSPTIQSPAIVTTSAEYEQVLKELENAIKRAQQKELDADAEAVKKANIETLNATEIKKLEDKIADLNKQISDQAIANVDKQIKQREIDILNKNIAISKAQQEINKTNTEKALYDAEQAKLEVIKAQITQLEAQLRINVNKMGNLSGNYDSLVLQLNALKDNDNILKNESNKLQSIIQKQVSAEATLNAEKTKEISDKLLALREKYINQSLASYLTELTSLAEIAKKNTQDAIDKKKQLTESTKNTSNIYLNLQDEEIKRLMLIQKKAEQLVVTERIEKMAKAEQDILNIRKQHYEDLQRMLKKMEKEQDTNLKILEATPYENTSLNRQITRITTDTSNVLKEEQKKYDELVNTQTQQINTLSNDINILRKTLLTIKDEIDAHIQNTISYRATTKRTEEEVKKLSIEMLKKRIELQKYKYTSNVLNIETSVSDINTKITLHINNTATYIANSIILSSLHKEYLDYSDEKDKIQAAEYSSTIDLEIQKRNNQIMIATIYLILNMLIATVIIFIIYGRRSLPYMSYILMLIYIPFIIFYIIEIVKIVHTRASHKYWRKPEQNFV